MAEVALAAEVRSAQGSSNSRRLRAAGKIPGVMYGHGIDPISVAVEGRALRLALNGEAGVNALLNIDIDGTNHLALARAIQKNPVRGTVAHVDFQVVNRSERITADVPVILVGEALQVTRNGGVVEHPLSSLNIEATPATLPSSIEVDITNLEIDNAIRVKDLILPEGVIAQIDGEEPVVVGAITRAALSEGEEAAAAEGGEAAAGGESAEAPASEEG